MYGDSWQDMYFFMDAQSWPADLGVMNFYSANSPQSYMVQRLVISRQAINPNLTLKPLTSPPIRMIPPELHGASAVVFVNAIDCALDEDKLSF